MITDTYRKSSRPCVCERLLRQGTLRRAEGRNVAQGGKAPEFASRIPASFHAVSAFFTPLSSPQLTGKPFDNMSNTGE
jgi:hypothetical protein